MNVLGALDRANASTRGPAHGADWLSYSKVLRPIVVCQFLTAACINDFDGS